MGEVYRAHDTKLRRDVAIKILPESFARDPERLKRFEREAHLLASLNHPHIGSIYGFEEAEGIHALVLELVDGQTLAERLTASAVPVAEALSIARQIADALDAAHERGVIHRDLKPANIKVTPDGTVKVLDFGLAKSTGDISAQDPLRSTTLSVGGTGEGVILGTAPYMSPEQARGKSLDKRSDIWSFGCVLYELLAGRRAFKGGTFSDAIAAVLEREPDWTALPDTTPPSIRRLLQRCLEKDLKRRMRDIGDARIELDDALAGATEAPPPVSGVDSSIRSIRLAWSVAIVLFIALVVTITLLVQSRIHPIAQSAAWSSSTAIPTQLTNYGGTEASGAIAPDGRSFVFVSDHGGTPDIWLRQISGGEPVRLTNDAAEERDLSYAPDGETIYFTGLEDGKPSIWRIGALGGQARKVISDAEGPRVSPDGRLLAYYSREQGGTYALEVSGIDGSGKRALTRHLRNAVGINLVSWSPDSRWIAYSVGGLFEPRNLFLIDVGTAQARQLSKFSKSNEGIYSCAWLPDNRHIVVSYVPFSRQQAPVDIGILDVQDGSISRLTMGVVSGFGSLSVSKDGSRLIATSQQIIRELWKVPLGPDPGANGRAAARLLDNSQDPMWTYVSRDGRTLLYSNSSVGSRNLWTMPLDGSSSPRQITAIPGEAVSHSSLSPDGTRVAFVSSATGNSDVWTQNVDGSDLRQLTDDAAADAWPVWSPDGHWIVFASLRNGSWETRRIPSAGGSAEKLIDGFFRGDWIRQPTGEGTWIVSSIYGSGLRLFDVERRTVLWEDRRAGGNLNLPMFSPDGRSISLPRQETRDRDAIWIFDAATGKSRVAVQFPQPFRIFFRANWVDDGKALVVNRYQNINHIVLFDRFQVPGRAQDISSSAVK